MNQDSETSNKTSFANQIAITSYEHKMRPNVVGDRWFKYYMNKFRDKIVPSAKVVNNPMMKIF